jgi:cell wall-associated NlpC family hydrolase
VAFVALAATAGTLTVATVPAGATLGSARHEAAVIYREIQSADAKVGLLGQRYDAAELKYHREEQLIADTQQIVAAAAIKVHGDQSQLAAAAVAYYVNSGQQTAENPLFTSNQQNAGAESVYVQIAQGDLASSVSALKSSSLELTQQKSLLKSQLHAAARATRAANGALRRAEAIQSSLRHTLSLVHGQIKQYIARAEQAAAAKALREWEKTHHGKPGKHHRGGGPYSNYPAPPPNSRGNRAVIAAESFLGVPYVWGGASRYGVDCSGLVMLAWRAAGVDLPHYSGAQFNDTIRIPLWDLKPGDLLFYGWHGDEHVTMYIGHGLMIEAPETGYVVHITPIRLGYGFAGAGRVR